MNYLIILLGYEPFFGTFRLLNAVACRNSSAFSSSTVVGALNRLLDKTMRPIKVSPENLNYAY